jgi:hypothetical protein
MVGFPSMSGPRLNAAFYADELEAFIADHARFRRKLRAD